MNDDKFNQTFKSNSINQNLSHLFIFDKTSKGFWGIHDRDIPILIGAAAGLLVLIVVILGAALIWFCCQFTSKQSKNIYSNGIKKRSISNHGLIKVNDNESLVFMGIDCTLKDLDNFNVTRSIAASLHSSLNQSKTKKDNFTYDLDGVCKSTIEKPIHDLKKNKRENDEKNLLSSRCHIYSLSIDNEIDNFKTRSLPRKKIQNISNNKLKDEQSQINFSKKRKNRMRNEIAAAIALNKSGAIPFKMPFLHKETDSLVDNEAIVVYDERTAL